jgi:hypothetical protein
MEGREGTVENVKFIAHWDRVVNDVIFAVVGNVDPVEDMMFS